MLRFIVIALLLPFSAAFAQDSTGPAWPAPPERARIRHLRTIDAASGLDQEEGFFGSVLGTLFGGKKTEAWLVQPAGIAVSAGGVLYVADPGARGVHILDLPEKTYRLVTGTNFGPFLSPVGCAVDREGLVYVTDSERGDVVVMDADGDGERSFKGPMERPTGIQVVGDTLYITDTGLHKVFLLDREGKPLGSFGGRGAGASEFNYPVTIAARDSLYVLDALNYRVQTFDRAGAFSGTFGALGNVAGRFANPKGIALDSDGDIYVADGLMDNIQIFDRAGRLLLIVGRNGTRDGEFVMPSGIAIGADDTIYVVDSFNRRIQIFRYYR